MDIHPIRSESDYEQALRELEIYVDSEPEPGTPEDERYEILLALVQRWEAAHYPVDPPDPLEAIKFHMEQAGSTPPR
ncbi:MAG: hypothetical protein LBB55_07145 [Zoogloeaceae bacterium]|jgi:HTH-type transcriptional regulator/antitoxin HigA|nr:hypothetical protein [Zoogloeaceae bacterium]